MSVRVGTVDLHALAGLAGWTRVTLGEPAFAEVCARAGIAPEAFGNGDRRVPSSDLESWLVAVRDRLGGDGAFLAAGMAGETPAVERSRALAWLTTPCFLYRGRAGRRWVTGGTGPMTVRPRGLGGATIRYTAAGPEGRAVCLWRQARLAQRTRAWALAPAVVHETRCLARGDGACEYVVFWDARARWTGVLTATGAAIASLVWASVEPGVAWLLPAVAASLAYAIETGRVRRANRAAAAAFGVAFRRATASTPAPAAVAEAPPPAPAPAEAEQASLRREGDFWRVSFEAKTVLIRHSRGLSLLVHLLRNPGEEIHVSALDALSPSDVGTPVATAVPADVRVGDLGDAGEILDAQAKATYRRRLGELREELVDAESCNDLGRVERLRVELEALTDQLRHATGLGGRSRRASSNADRVRVAVTRRIRAAIAQIEKHHPPLGAHLTATIHTGYFCSYGPGGVAWTESRDPGSRG